MEQKGSINENMMFTMMREVCNFFIRRDGIQRYEGEVTIHNQELSIPIPSPYVIIRGSHHNDGLYVVEDGNKLHPCIFEEGDLYPTDEVFVGRVWFSYPPQDFIALSREISAFESAETAHTGVVSESFGSSSRSYAQGSNGRITWQEQYGNVLRTYRTHMFEEIW